MSADETVSLLQAEREGWATYMPSPLLYVAGALAALGVMVSPLLLHSSVALITLISELIRYGRVDLYSALYPSYAASIYYLVAVWPFIIGVTALGVPLAYLRQKRGFHLRTVRGTQFQYVSTEAELNSAPETSLVEYRKRWVLPIDPHILILYMGGPIVLWWMAYHVNPRVYPALLYNAFAIWLASGVAARFAWEWLQITVLRVTSRWYGLPRQSLRAEYQLKRVIEGDPALSYFSIWDVRVTPEQRHAMVVANIKGDAALRRLREVASFINEVETIEVQSYPGELVLPPNSVIRSR